MEVVVQTDYQDIYRITDGVLFIVNKFIPVDYSNDTPKKIYLYQSDMKYRLYNKFCQKRLKVLKEDYKNKYCPVVIPKGTVMYMTYTNGNFYRDQDNGFFRTLGRKLRKIFAILFTQDYYYAEAIFSKEDFEVFREYINSFPVHKENSTDAVNNQ